MRLVLDTNVLVAALRSSRGASAEVLRALPIKGWEVVLSVPLYFEYQAVLLRPGLLPPAYTPADIKELCDYVASIAHKQDIYYLRRSILADPKDDLLLELAVAAQAKYILTHNTRHFLGSDRFGVSALAPREFLRLVRGRYERRDN